MKYIDSIKGYEKGDWVRFMRDNTLVIAEVEYFFEQTGGFKYLVTDKGSVALESVVEKRSP